MKKLAVFTVLAVSACSHTYNWQNAGANLTKDDYECRKEGYQIAGASGTADAANVAGGRDIYERCMAARGYVDKNR